MPYRKVLIIRLSALGDVAMTIPVVYSVCRAYPETTFVMLTQKVASQLFINAPRNLQVVVADVKGPALTHFSNLCCIAIPDFSHLLSCRRKPI